MPASCSLCEALSADDGQVIFENALWQVRPIEPPAGVPGWILLVTRRHVASGAQLNEREQRSYGPTWCHLQRVLLEVTGAQRIYTATLGELTPHFHCHLVPRFERMPSDALGFAVFDLQRAAKAGELVVDPADVAKLSAQLALALKGDPPPAP
jgi:diadenosine tetraphosphate (Ap4A) HIT family hydrolase